MQIYRQGSYSLPNERELNVPEVQWLGVRIDDILVDVQDDESVLKLTARDRRKAVAMLERSSSESTDKVDEQCRMELQQMLMLNIKAEIQILEERPWALERWLNGKMGRQLSKSISL
jgi:meiotic recombination protein SPO11